MPKNDPHPLLIPLLEKHDLSWELFCKQGRPPLGVSAKRRAIVTELHEAGHTWEKMAEITGKPTSFIQRNTDAMWNDASRENIREVGRKVGASWKGKKRLGQLEAQWANGDFDHLRGKPLSEETRQKLRAGWTPEKRQQRSQCSKALWVDLVIRDRLLAFHRSPEERVKRSRAQCVRMEHDPEKWTRGHGAYLYVSKCLNGQRIWVRSSYEQAAVILLEEDPQVALYQYERTFELKDGTWIKPDFVVQYASGETVMVEVKAGWVFKLPDTDPVQVRLRKAAVVAKKQGWAFQVWVEEELADALNRTA